MTAAAPETAILPFLPRNDPATSIRTAATLDRLSQGRPLINVATGCGPADLHGDGV